MVSSNIGIDEFVFGLAIDGVELNLELTNWNRPQNYYLRKCKTMSDRCTVPGWHYFISTALGVAVLIETTT